MKGSGQGYWHDLVSSGTFDRRSDSAQFGSYASNESRSEQIFYVRRSRSRELERQCLGGKSVVMFETKIAIIVREDLATWQKLNVTAFLMSGVVGAYPEIIGQAYRDADNNAYHSLCIQPIIVLAADRETIAVIHKRALDRRVPHCPSSEHLALMAA